MSRGVVEVGGNEIIQDQKKGMEAHVPFPTVCGHLWIVWCVWGGDASLGTVLALPEESMIEP